jgi:hypothetical protein
MEKRYCIKCGLVMFYHQPAWAWICDNNKCDFRGLHQEGISEKERNEKLDKLGKFIQQIAREQS